MKIIDRSSKFRYSIFALLFSIILINYIDRGALSFAINNIQNEFGFSKVEVGAILGYFGLGYLVGAVLGGVLGDRYGTKKIWLVFGILWSVIEILMAWAGEIGSFFFGSALIGFAFIRILFGLCEGPAFPLMAKSISNWAPKNEQSLSLSFGLVSTQVGALLTAPIAVFLLMITNSWRMMFICLGIVSLICMFLFYRVYEDSPNNHKRVSLKELNYIQKDKQVQLKAPKSPWWEFFRNKTLLLNAFGYFTFLYITFTLVSWGPKYLQDTFNYDLKSLWYIAMLPWVGSTITVLLGGYISDFLARKYNLKIARNGFACVMLLCTALCFFLIPVAHSSFVIITLICLGNAFNAMANNIYYSVIVDISPRESIASNVGFTLSIANIASFAAPFLSGILINYYSYNAIFYATACIALFSMLCMFFIEPNSKRGELESISMETIAAAK